MNQLKLLNKYTKIVGDTSNITEIIRYHPIDATTNPSLILKGAILQKNNFLLENAIIYAHNLNGKQYIQLVNSSDKFLMNISLEILKYIPGKVSIEIDARLSFNSIACIAKAHKLIDLYQLLGINKSRILIKLACTWEGIQAAKQLQKEGINCNMTLLFSYIQAKACADAGAYLISPFVGRISDWYYHYNLNNFQSNISLDAGVNFVRNIFNFYKKNNYQTIIMAASFRNIFQITSLTGCDALTISPTFLHQLKICNNSLTKKLFPAIKKVSRNYYLINEFFFRYQYNQDTMSVEKLAEGIRKFSYDQFQLEQLLIKYL
ncbi:MAG: transaldolase family protein [Candidatus Dasytiphilus stammeri]